MIRLKILKLIYILIFFSISARLFYWQILKSDDLTSMAENQHSVSLTLLAPRGIIFSSDRSILASNKPSFLLFGLPKAIKDKESVAVSLASILGVNKGLDENSKLDTQKYLTFKDQIKKNLSQDLYWTTLMKNIDLDDRDKINKLNITGLGFDNQTERYYPEASMAAHLLGFVGSDPLGRPTGYFGLEGFYNGELKGISGSLVEEKDAQGLPIIIGNFFQRQPRSGHNLILNIDRTVQFVVENELKKGMEKYGAKSASVVVMEPRSGAVLAMASVPNYDPGKFNEFPKEYFKNPIVADSYEPGSTFKSLVMAAALNEDLVKPDTKCNICAGPVNIGGFTIRTWNNQYQPNLSMTDVIIHSDNTGMVFVSQKLGLDRMYQYISDFGFGNPTGIDLQDETSPEIRDKNDWHEVDLATSSFGQGIAVTPIQMVRAVSAIANGGYLMEPHVVSEIQSDEKTIKIKPKVIRRVISEKAANDETQMMVEAVEKGEAKFVALKGFKVAGKTGTAQIPIAGHYDPEKTIASFIGFAPADDPKFVMLVKYEQPTSSIFGAETAAPTFFAIAKQLFAYYKITPTE